MQYRSASDFCQQKITEKRGIYDGTYINTEYNNKALPCPC